jgi:bifunctional UDP-N-acetylglucosamine pyrophosphorylase/glucosamine-1-phosphate N-acetyltransferase
MSLNIVILAAGLGKRMNSNIPKGLHSIAGKPMLARVIETAQLLQPESIHVIYGHGGEKVMEALTTLAVNWVFQEGQLGTGHAVMQALPYIPEHSKVIILSADVPLIQSKTLEALLHKNLQSDLTLLVASLPNPTGLGRIIRNEKREIEAIIEEKDASESQKNIQEIYSGICCAKAADLARWLPNLTNNNAQKELYLTEIISKAVQEGLTIGSLKVSDTLEIQGVNNRLQLQELERIYQKRQAEQLLLAGVQIADSSRFDLRGELICGKDVFIDINCLFIGQVRLGDNCRIGPNCIISNTEIDANSEIYANSLIEESKIGKNSTIGPFARLRKGTRLEDSCKIGNFVETKNTVFAAGSKASHLSYLGDALLGKNVNIGAGTITCNYDGVNKHKTIIEDGAFIGSDTQLVAPVTIGANATVGAGSTIRNDVPANELTLTESKQKTVFGWKRPEKSKQ